jgi:hypothetical protein
MASSNDETVRLLLDVVGEEGMERLGKSVANTRGLIEALGQSFLAGDVSAEEFERGSLRLSQELARQTTLLEQLRGEQARQADAARAAAQALEEEAEAIALATQQAQALARADAAVAAASLQVNAALEAEATALGNERNAMFAAEAEMVSFASKLDTVDQVGNAAGGTFVTVGNKAQLAAQGIKAAGGAAGAARSGFGGFQQTIVAGSYAMQDFTSTSGDLGAKLNSVTNNLPGMLVSFGAWGIAISTLATGAVALYRNWDSVASLWETRNPFPKSAKDVEGLKRELERAKDEMEKFEKAGTGNATQLARYNELRATTARIEKEIADQTERQARLKKFLEGKTEEEEARGKGYQEATQGRGQEYLDKIREALRKDGEQQIEHERLAMNQRLETFSTQDHTLEEQDRFMREQADRFKEFERSIRSNDWGERARELNDRLLQGEDKAGKILERLMQDTGVFFDGLRERMDEKNPLKKQARDKLTDELNAQGQEGEKAALDELKKARDEIQDRIKSELEAMKDLGTIDKVARESAEAAKAKGLAPDAAFAAVRDELKKLLPGALEMRGAKIPDGLGVDTSAIDKAAADAAGKATGAGAQKAAAAEADKDRDDKAKADEAEAKKLRDEQGKPLQERYEQLVAANAERAARGAPVARSKTEEAKYQRSGQAYALPQEVLEGRLQRELAAGFRHGGASEQGANLAAAGIGQAGTLGFRQKVAAAKGQAQQAMDQGGPHALQALRQSSLMGQAGQETNAAMLQAIQEIITNQQALFAEQARLKQGGRNAANAARKIRVQGETRLRQS